MIAKVSGGRRPAHLDFLVAAIASGYWQKANKVLVGLVCGADTLPGMKPILYSIKEEGGKLPKRQKGPATNAAKCPVRAASLPSRGAMRVRKNDPLAIGIEELEQCIWPPLAAAARSLHK